MANQKVGCSVEQLLCLEILLLPAEYKDSSILTDLAIYILDSVSVRLWVYLNIKYLRKDS